MGTWVWQLLRNHKIATGWLLLFACMPLLSSSIVSVLALGYEEWMRVWPWYFWAVWYIIASIGMGLAILPTTLVAIIGGYLLGFASLPPMVLAYLCAVAICYFLAKQVGAKALLSDLADHPNVVPYLTTIQKKPIATVAYAKLSPVLPFGLSNILLAFLGVRLAPFLLGSLIGMLPRTCLATFVGWQAQLIGKELQEAKSPSWSWLVLLLLTVASLWGLGKVFAKKSS